MKTCRRKWFVQWVAAFVSIVLFGTYLGSLSMNTLTVSAICCRKDGFDKSRYTLTGNVAQDVATIAKSQAGRTCSDFGYSGVDYGAWCDEYVADCLENAGCDDSIVAHGGTVADFENKMRKRGAVAVSSPQPGDLLFFSWSHVEIVTRVEGGTVYCAGGNNQGKTYPGGRCAGERNAQSVAKSMGGSIRLYLRPNYPDSPKEVTATTVSTAYKYYAPNSNVIIQWDKVDNAMGYWIDIYKDNEHLVSERINSDINKYTIECCSKGNYGVFVATIGEKNTECSALYNFYVQDVEAPQVITEKNHYPIGADVKISWNTPIGATSYWIDIWHNDTKILSQQLGSENEYLLSNCSEGNYAVYVTSMENTGEISLATNERYIFSVGQIEAPNIVLEREYYSPGSDVVVSWNSVDEATSYWIDVWNGENHICSKQLDSTINTYTIKNCLEGHYAIFITSIESAGGAYSKRSEIKYFQVANVEAPHAFADKDVYFEGEDVLITWDTPNGTTSYWIDVWRDNEQIKSEQLGDENEYYLMSCKTGAYSVIITAFENTGELSTASSDILYFNIYKYGDCNNDNDFTVADAVLLQRYLLGEDTLTQSQWQTADLNADGTVNGFDLALLRQKLVG